MSDPIAKKTPKAKGVSGDTSIPQALLEFLSRHLDKFPLWVRITMVAPNLHRRSGGGRFCAS